ncbi:uncharacterized protein LOC132697148 [Cylas formicarius]|uniref:uncharacterized protein LOC132697148 n=1 Tax=Cylas formicarius TaxID=197179 RepID=UPI002958D571|nr:uncharacterized protein LOC132697148 [Cylas formicarius]
MLASVTGKGVCLCTILWILDTKGVFSLKNVTLSIEPSVVQYRNTSKLRCTYDLEGDALYTVKWYRGSLEFYRYTPSEKERDKRKQAFPFKGVTIDVDRSDSTQVTLNDIDFVVSGEFCCEVTTEDSHIHALNNCKSMVVVQLPEHPPEISVRGEPFDYGDILRANCSSYRSRPPADLTLILNGITVNQTEPLALRKLRPTDYSDLQLELKLSDLHFQEGQLNLQCVAQVSSVYHETVGLELQSVRHPVPEKVSAPNTASAASTASSQTIPLRLFCFTMLCFNAESVIKILIKTIPASCVTYYTVVATPVCDYTDIRINSLDKFYALIVVINLINIKMPHNDNPK